MRPQVLLLLAVCGIPQPDGLILSSGCQQSFVRAISDVPDDSSMSAQFAKQLAIGRIPVANGLILTARGQHGAVRAEGDAIYRRGMTGKGPCFFAARVLPQLYRVVETPAGKQLAVGAEGETVDQGVVPFELARGLTVSNRANGTNQDAGEKASCHSLPFDQSAACSSTVATGAKPRRMVFSVIVRGTTNCNR